jgi:hypothetical protein
MSRALVVLLFAGLFAASLSHVVRRGASRIARILAVVCFGLGLLLALLPSLSRLG